LPGGLWFAPEVFAKCLVDCRWLFVYFFYVNLIIARSKFVTDENFVFAARRFLLFALAILFSSAGFVWAQEKEAANQSNESAREQLIVENIYDGDLFCLNKDVIVKGSVTKGVVSFGGNVIVEGRVEGDVAAVGGTVYQRPGSFIGGDVVAIGGGYNHGKTAPGRNPNTQTVMYAGYEKELRETMQNPVSLFAPSFTSAFFIQRIIMIFFWFVV
jgi:hypothetical protein